MNDVMMTTITRNELSQLMEEAALKAVSTISGKPQPIWVSREEVAQITGLSLVTVTARCQKEYYQSRRLGKRRVINLIDVISMMNEKEMEKAYSKGLISKELYQRFTPKGAS